MLANSIIQQLYLKIYISITQSRLKIKNVLRKIVLLRSLAAAIVKAD